MKIGIVGAGRIGGNCAVQFARGGHDVMLSFSREPAKLDELAQKIGDRASIGTPAEATTFGDVFVFAVPWDLIPDVLDQLRPLDGKIVIDTTNQFGSGPMPAEGQTAAAFNAARMTGARYTKSFNTLSTSVAPTGAR